MEDKKFSLNDTLEIIEGNDMNAKFSLVRGLVDSGLVKKEELKKMFVDKFILLIRQEIDKNSCIDFDFIKNLKLNDAVFMSLREYVDITWEELDEVFRKEIL